MQAAVGTTAQRFHVGAFECTVVSDGSITFPLEVADLFAAATAAPGEVAALQHALGIERGEGAMGVNVLLVRAHRELILVDLGFGAGHPDTGRLLPALRDIGVAPTDITTVLLTHLHPDHTGGLVTADGTLAFAKARYVVGREEWEFWSRGPDLRETLLDDGFRALAQQSPQQVITALHDRVRLVESGDEVVPGVRVHLAPGHTPGQLVVELSSNGERLLHLADVVVYAHTQLRRPDWFGFSDNWPTHTVATRRRILEWVVTDRLRVLGYHFPFPGVGSITRDGAAYRFVASADAHAFTAAP